MLALLVLFAKPAAAQKRVSSSEALQAAVKKPHPPYNPLARQMKIEGEVEVEVSISEKGDVVNVKVNRGNAMLTPKVVETVKGWKFTPFQQDGRVCPAVAPLRFSFRM
ncbi:MAG: energy transducer TonB [Bryobacteraceae bacterium]|nr:energy transducer TonB [Bryobacteraceae bacterium]